MSGLVEEKRAIAILESSGDYRVLRRILPRAVYENSLPNEIIVSVVDTETTGFNAEDKDCLVELGALKATVDPSTGRVGRIIDRLNEFKDPGFEMDASVVQVHGLTNEFLRGRSIDLGRVQDFFSDVQFCVAHNAAFDKPFMVKEVPSLSAMPFVCSFKDIDWKAEGLGSLSLSFLAFSQGKFYDAHRAVDDCIATLDVLSEPLPSSAQMPFKILSRKSQIPTFTVAAAKAAYAKKDDLKAAGYRWAPERSWWQMELQSREEIRPIVTFLKDEIYRGVNDPIVALSTCSPAERFGRSAQNFVNVPLSQLANVVLGGSSPPVANPSVSVAKPARNNNLSLF